MSAFDPAAWVRRWESAGGGWSIGSDGKLWFLLPEQQDNLTAMMSEMTGSSGRAAAVRMHLIGRP